MLAMYEQQAHHNTLRSRSDLELEYQIRLSEMNRRHQEELSQSKQVRACMQISGWSLLASLAIACFPRVSWAELIVCLVGRECVCIS